MFGYIKPVKPELKIREYEYYRANYCGLCNSLRTRCGFLARFIVNYDFTFVSILLSYAQKRKPVISKKRCIVCPSGRACAVSDVSDRVADISVILSYLKLCDDITDKKSLRARILKLLLTSAYRKAEKAEPDFSQTAVRLFSELADIERAKVPSIDEPADKFALMLSSVVDDGDKNCRVLREILYHIGRFVYIIDSLDDFSEDAKASEYNPIAMRFKVSTEELPTEITEEIVATLNLSINSVLRAFELLDNEENSNLIRNIIELGMRNSIALVLKKEK